MSEARTAGGIDRLPWLTDEPEPRAQAAARRPWRAAAGISGGVLAAWVIAGVIVVAGGSYWLGSETRQRWETQQIEASAPPSREATLPLPEPRAIPQPQVSIAPAPVVTPAPAPTVRLAEPRIERAVSRQRRQPMSSEVPPAAHLGEIDKALLEASAAEKVAADEKPAETAAATTTSSSTAARRRSLTRWPSRVTKGASGRLVQIGAFGSRQQAKLGWRRMQRAYPAVGRLPAVVVEARNSRGKRFYRFQIGTTSQAHSEVLCQRMQRIHFSCAVVGLSWKSKVER